MADDKPRLFGINKSLEHLKNIKYEPIVMTEELLREGWKRACELQRQWDEQPFIWPMNHKLYNYYKELGYINEENEFTWGQKKEDQEET